MKKLLYFWIFLFCFLSTIFGEEFAWRYRYHATDVTSITDGLEHDIGYEGDSQRIFVCTNTSGASSPSDWKLVGSSSWSDSFVDGDLSSGILTVTHNLGRQYVAVQIYDNNDQLVAPDDITLTSSSVATIDLSSWGSISGTWHVIILDSGTANNLIPAKIQDADGDTSVSTGTADSDEIVFENAGVETGKFDANGRLLLSYQPAFSVKKSTDQTSIAINTAVTVIFDSEIKDIGSNFASNTFTSPVNGLYQINVVLYCNYLDTAANYYDCRITTSNRTYNTILDFGGMSGDPVYWNLNVSQLVDMEQGDTLVIQVYQSAGTSQTYITANSYVSGFLVATY